MIVVIEHKDRNGNEVYIRRVPDDRAESTIACLPCKGIGYIKETCGTLGNLFFDGFTISYFRTKFCECCYGRGIWQTGR